VSPRLATAPVTWGVWERTIGGDDLVSPEAMLEAGRELGYRGIELGPLGYFGADRASVEAALEPYGLELAGAFVELHLADGEAFDADAELLESTLAILAGTGAPLVLADAGSEERGAASGQPERLERTALGARALEAALNRLNTVVGRCREMAVAVTFHPHAATYFETPHEVEWLLGESDVGICLDTGHSVIGGADPIELAELCGERLAHLHLKDVDAGILERLRAGALDIERAWEQGLFCPFGEGAVDLPGFLALDRIRSFDGWIVLEQDRFAVRRDLVKVREVERRNRERVLSWAGWSSDGA
jgi:inosose dehydratase